VEAQTFRDFETVVLDDGSTDGSFEVATQFSWLRVLRQPNQGIAAARQWLIEEASGEWVLFLDHDDELEPAALDHLVGSTNAREVLAHGRVRMARLGQKPVVSRWIPALAALPLDHLLPNNQISVGGVLARREELLKFGFEPGVGAAEDWLMWFRLASVGQFRFVDEVVATIHKREGSASHPGLAWYEAERHVLEDYVLPNLDDWYEDVSASERQRFRLLLRRKLGIIASLEGACLDAVGRKAEAKSKHRQAIRDAPSKGAFVRFLRHLVF